jgi:hypothetical protein
MKRAPRGSSRSGRTGWSDRADWADWARHAFAELADGAIVLVAGATAVIAGLMVAGAIGTVAAAVRVPSTAQAPATAPAAASVTSSLRPTPSAAPSPTAAPVPAIAVSPYRSGGRSYAGIEARAGTVFGAPLEGIVEIRLYQYINNEVRVGSNVPSLPFFPYVTIVAPDRRLTFRAGALGVDSELLTRDGQRVGVGAPLFRTTGPGRSSWATFYDRTIPFQVVASLVSLPSLRDLDPLIGYLAD